MFIQVVEVKYVYDVEDGIKFLNACNMDPKLGHMAGDGKDIQEMVSVKFRCQFLYAMLLDVIKITSYRFRACLNYFDRHFLLFISNYKPNVTTKN